MRHQTGDRRISSVRGLFAGICVLAFALIAGCQQNDQEYGNDSIIIQAISGVEDLHQFSIRDMTIEIANDGTGDGAPYYIELALVCGGDETALTAQPVDCESLSAGGGVTVTQRIIIPGDTIGPCAVAARAKRDGVLLSEKTLDCTVDVIPSETEPNDSRYGNANAVLLNQGYSGSSSSPADEDWFVLTLPAGSGVGITGDGDSGTVQIEGYVGTSGAPAVSFSDDGFADGRSIMNNTAADVTVYLNVMSGAAQEYRYILEEISN